MSEGEGIKIMAPQVCTLGCVTSEAEASELMLVNEHNRAACLCAGGGFGNGEWGMYAYFAISNMHA